MVPALFTALGAVLVGVIAVVGSRLEARDERGRLAKDVDVLIKLPARSEAHELLEHHVTRSVRSIAVGDRRRHAFRGTVPFLALAYAFVAVSIVIQLALGGSKHQAFLTLLRGVGERISTPFLVLAVVTAVLSVLSLVFGLITLIKDKDFRRLSKDFNKSGDIAKEDGRPVDGGDHVKPVAEGPLEPNASGDV